MIKQLSLPVFICSILKNHTKTIHYSSQIIYILNLLTMLSVPIYTTFTFQIWRYQCIDLRNTIKFVKEMSPVLWMCIFYLRFVALIFESVHHNKDLGFHEITCKSDSICFLNTPRYVRYDSIIGDMFFFVNKHCHVKYRHIKSNELKFVISILSFA